MRAAALLVAMGFGASAHAQPVLTVTGADGGVVGDYRWVLEEDATVDVTPGVRSLEAPSVTFHKSHMPVVASGAAADWPPANFDPSQRYFVSVLPDSGYDLGGAKIPVGATDVAITVNAFPLPAAQISVYVFEDTLPLNNIPDAGETGLAGFTVNLEDGGGRYGQSGGQVLEDLYGNPLGTTYNPDGTVLQQGDGTIVTDENGLAIIKNVAPGKYGVIIVPPTTDGAGNEVHWSETTTIEGTKVNDAWVKEGEPKFFVEFGPPGQHVFFGFVNPDSVNAPGQFDDNGTPIAGADFLTGNATISGRIVNQHQSRPPNFEFFGAAPPPATSCRVALNDLTAGAGRAVYVSICDPDTNEFSFAGVPNGSYQLGIWDSDLLQIFASYNIVIEGGQCVTAAGAPGEGDCAFGDIPVNNWFQRLDNVVFFDLDSDGFPDPGEPGLREQNVNVRWRDGTIYQAFPTDLNGYVPFDTLFPFFHWLVAEVDFGRFKATGATYIVDNGGDTNSVDLSVNHPYAADYQGLLVPQPQAETNPNTGDNLSTTLQGEVLTLGFQGFLGSTNAIFFGKNNYAPFENGGISGIVYYATTRAEEDPRLAAAEPWEPGIPRVQVNLYEDTNADGVIDDRDGSGDVTLADVDNYPLGWSDGGVKGDEDLDRNGDGVFDLGDAIYVTRTDSWDDNEPTGCVNGLDAGVVPPGAVNPATGLPLAPFTHSDGVNTVTPDCYDGLRNYNQIREAVFDGGYIFGPTMEGGPYAGQALPPGGYIVETAIPPGYEQLKEEDKNVDFGEENVAPQLLAPVCVGDLHTVPDLMSLFDTLPAPFAGEIRPYCDRKQVQVLPGQNTAADFYLFTTAPVAAHAVGYILADTANEFDPRSPQFGEKYAPPFLPISVRDWTGQEVTRVYSDEYGKYNFLAPSTFTNNLPQPSGVGPQMLQVCMNDPGPILMDDPANPGVQRLQVDPAYSRQYSQFCYTLQFMPGVTTYLDTPVLPIAAHANTDLFPLDCASDDGTPRIFSVRGNGGGDGPAFVSQTGNVVTIVSMGSVEVPNPDYDGPEGSQPKTITRDYGFGDIIGRVQVGGRNLRLLTWSNDVITARVRNNTFTGELVVRRGDNRKESDVGVTLQIGLEPGQGQFTVLPSADPSATPIQDAVDLAQPGDLIMVEPGLYNESVVLWKPVTLKGAGHGSTTISAINVPTQRIDVWRDKVVSIVNSGAVDLTPGQLQKLGGVPLLNPPDPGQEVVGFETEEHPGIMILAADGETGAVKIDGFTVTGASVGGGIFANGFAQGLEISNNHITGNQGIYGGGIRLGHPLLTQEVGAGLAYDDSGLVGVSIHHNSIDENGGLESGGGGIAIYSGADGYRVTENHICGNFSGGNGGGVGHLGFSDGGLIEANDIRFNQSFNQGLTVAGGGIFIGGLPALVVGALSDGAGSVDIHQNRLHANLAGAGDGGGIALDTVNGVDVTPGSEPDVWNKIGIYDNMITNNVTGLAGGGISVANAVNVEIVHNTIANNDSTATAGGAFQLGNPNQSNPQPAGVALHGHSPELEAAVRNSIGRIRWLPLLPIPNLNERRFSNPLMANNIVWQNRSFAVISEVDPDLLVAVPRLTPDIAAGEAPVYDDFGLIGLNGTIRPYASLLTSIDDFGDTNVQPIDSIVGNPRFFTDYVNGDRTTVQQIEVTTSIAIQPAFDEGGNFIDVRFGPLSTDDGSNRGLGDYHIRAASAAQNVGNLDVPSIFPLTATDFDDQPRSAVAGVDAGADDRP